VDHPEPSTNLAMAHARLLLRSTTEDTWRERRERMNSERFVLP